MSPRETVVRRAPAVLWQRVGDRVVVLDPDNGCSVSLNRTAARLWERLEAPVSAAELAATLAAEWRLEPARARADVDAFVQALSARGLVALTPPGGPPGG